MLVIDTGEKKQTLGYILNYVQDLTKAFPLSKCLAKFEGEEMVGEVITFQDCS